MIKIIAAEQRHFDQICHLILDIEQRELGIEITLADQPDLLDIPNFYQKNRGQFWVAENELNEVVGTIALIDLGEKFGTIRKMFVRADFRGKPHETGQKLLETLEKWAFLHHFEQLLLGTSDALHAACRFYVRNLFVEISKENLPKIFPIMSVNNVFYQKKLI
jgi:putative acetyltransferase